MLLKHLDLLKNTMLTFIRKRRIKAIVISEYMTKKTCLTKKLQGGRHDRSRRIEKKRQDRQDGLHVWLRQRNPLREELGSSRAGGWGLCPRRHELHARPLPFSLGAEEEVAQQAREIALRPLFRGRRCFDGQRCRVHRDSHHPITQHQKGGLLWRYALE